MTIADASLIDWTERQYISQFSTPPLSLSIHIGGALADPDNQAVSAQWFAENPDGSVAQGGSYTATYEQAGVYTVTPLPSDTAAPSPAELVWSYSIGGVAQQYASYLVIGPANPAYDALPLVMQDFLNAQVWTRFADLIDSAGGGPNLQTYFQAHWSRGRVAQLMGIALQKINTAAQPFSTYSLDGLTGPQFSIQMWGGLLATYTYCECIKHLMRGYAEQPAFTGASVARLDRRDYLTRWQSILNAELAELRSQLDVFKIRHILNGNPRVLVSGGTYGRYAPTRIAGSVAARPRMWARWY